jgi:hypothetical protein
MAPRSVEIVRDVYDVFNRGGWPAASFTEDFELDT